MHVPAVRRSQGLLHSSLWVTLPLTENGWASPSADEFWRDEDLVRTVAIDIAHRDLHAAAARGRWRANHCIAVVIVGFS